MSEEVKLLPCPFCGGEAALNTVRYGEKTVAEQEWDQDEFHGVNCVTCGVNNIGLRGHDSPEMATEAWNTRLAAQSAAPVGGVWMPLAPTQQIIDRMTASIDCVDIPTSDDPPDRDYDYDMRKAYRAALSCAAPAPSAAQWQPISTAPRDGEFLVYLPEEHRKYQVMYRTERTSIIGGAFAFDMSKPTDWMPLPAPPAHPGEQKPPSQTYATFGSDRVSMRSEKV